MAPRPKVPFTLHPAAKLRANVDLASATDVALSPDGAVAAVVSGAHGQKRLALHTLATGAVDEAVGASAGLELELPVWSRDGRRWAVGAPRFEGGVQRGVILMGERGGASVVTASTAAYGLITRNNLARPAAALAFAPSGDRVTLRATARDDRNALFHVDPTHGAVEERWLPAGEADVYAHAYAADGTLYTASADPGDAAGLAWFPPGATAPAGRQRQVFGFAVLPGRTGLWVLGQPQYAFRVGAGRPRPIALAREARLARAELLRARASAKWDQSHCDRTLERARANQTSYSYRVDPMTSRNGAPPEPAPGARCFENELLWETSYAGLMGEDAAVGDGVAVWLWRDDGASVTRDLLIEDAARSTFRGARIIGLSTAGDTLALLWRKDAGGEKTVLSLFDLDRAAL